MITTRQETGILVCELGGRLDATSSEAAATELLALVGAGNAKLLLNLKTLDYVSSIGLRVFVRVAKATHAAGGALKLCAPTTSVAKVLEISGMDNLLDLHTEESAALAAF
jgi:anti-anti-sigma factor